MAVRGDIKGAPSSHPSASFELVLPHSIILASFAKKDMVELIRSATSPNTKHFYFIITDYTWRLEGVIVTRDQIK